MRVISGTLKGRQIKGYLIEGTRPTMDRVKESLFAMIQDHINNAVVLDLFAGSGNLGIEAISNGAKKCYFNDKNDECIKIIQENISIFGIREQCVVLNVDYLQCLKNFHNENTQFDLVFLDPPYKLECLNEVITYLVDQQMLNANGLIVCEISHDYLQDFESLEKMKSRRYGDKTIIVLKNKRQN